MLLLITDDGIRGLPILFTGPLSYLIYDHNCLFFVLKRSMLYGIISVQHISPRGLTPFTIITPTA